MTVAFDPPASETPVVSRPIPSAWGRDRCFRFGFLVTDQAIYFPIRRAGFHLAEDLAVRRVPLADVSRVALGPARLITPQALLYAGGVLFFSLLASSFTRPSSAFTSALFYVLFMLLALTRVVLGSPGRFRLAISTAAETVEFTPTADDLPFPPGRRRAREVQVAFVQACAQVGVTVVNSDGTPFTAAPNPGMQRTRYARR